MLSMIRRLTGICLIFLLGAVHAQVDTSGGIGGTGVNDGRDLLAPANAEHQQPTGCSRDSSIGRYQSFTAKSSKPLREGYLCRGQEIRSGRGESLKLQLWSGESATLPENSRLIID